MLYHALFMHDRPHILNAGDEGSGHPHFMNMCVSLGPAGLRHAAVNCDLRIFVLSLASQFCEDVCAPLYRMLVGQVASGICI